VSSDSLFFISSHLWIKSASHYQIDVWCQSGTEWVRVKVRRGSYKLRTIIALLLDAAGRARGLLRDSD
jgi:hypothetical protein